MKLRLLPLAGVIIALLAPAQHASANDGALSYTAHIWTDEPGPGTQCAAGIFQDLNLSFDANPVPGCPDDGFYLDIRGSIYSPGPATTYTVLSDDGIRVTIDGILRINNWWDRGCSGFTHALELSEGWHELSVEFYENGGGTCLEVFQDQGNGPQPIPATYLAGPGNVPQTTTTTNAPTKPIAPIEVYPVPATTLPESVIETTTTTTYQPTDSSTIPATTSTIETSNQISPATPSTQPEIPATVASTSEPTSAPTTTSTTTTSSIPETITETMSNDEAVAVVTDAEAVAELTPDEAAAVFAAIDEGAVTPELAAAIIEAVQDAPPSIREQFEDKINIFGGVYDGYVPLGSLVPVGTRRIIIISTGLLVAMPSTRRK